MSKISLIILVTAAVCIKDFVFAIYVSPGEWAEYKAKYNKDYTKSGISEAHAQYFYAYNKILINQHNILYDRGARTYKLAVNQFTDMRLKYFNALFPEATSTGPSYDSALPAVQPAPPSYNPFNDLGFASTVENQGTKCNSGWAYSTAEAIKSFQAQQQGNMSPLSLSAQNLIDCAGSTIACTKQVPQAAFDYMTRFNMELLLERDYKNNNTLKESGMCTPNGQLVTNLTAYSRLRDGDEDSLRAYVSNGFPIVVEINPTSFEFMHYSEGVFQQPTVTRRGSHFVVVYGYGFDTKTGLNYWLLQNSFGTTWGEMGLMKLQRNPKKMVIKNAILPTELA